MIASGSLVGARFRVLRNLGSAASAIALAADTSAGKDVWLVQVPVQASAAQIGLTLEQLGRFAVGVAGLARPLASGLHAGGAFIAYLAPAGGSVAEAHSEAWPRARVAALATRIAGALGPIHDQGIAYGCLRPELVGEGATGEVLFGFGVAAVATAFGAPGEASQCLPPEYRAPELRAALLPPTPASDVFALGVLLRDLSGAASAELNACLERALAANPRERARDVREFAAEFARIALLTPETAPALGGAVPSDTDALPVAPATQAPFAEIRDPLSVEVLGPPLAPPLVPPTSAPALLRPVYVPPPFAMPPPASRSSVLGVWLLLGAGLLLMVGGVLGASFYAARRAAALIKAATPVLHAPIVAAPVPVPVPAPPPSAAEEAPPLAPPAGSAESAEIEPDHVSRAHPPLVLPGVGLASFPEEASAVLPVLGSEPIWGTRNAPLTWVLFGDLDCPHTRRAWRALEAIKVTFGDDLRIVFRHRPLREHPNAFDAASVLAGLAKRRGPRAFFDVLHRIARDDASLTPEHLQALLTASGFSDSKPSELAALGEPTVFADAQLAGQYAIKSTPFSFLNGRPIDGERSPAELERLLLEERRAATWSLAAGVSASTLYATRSSSNLIGVGEQGDARACVPVGDSPVRGASDALVTLVEFSDFECPFCKSAEPAVRSLLERYPKNVRLVWKDFPLPQHKNARFLANFAADANARGSSTGFWAVHDALFTHAGALDDSALGELAGKAGMDGALLLISARSGIHDAAIHADMALAQKLGVKGTPTFFVNGRPIQGVLPPEQFDALVQEELKSAQRIVARGVARKEVYALTCD